MSDAAVDSTDVPASDTWIDGAVSNGRTRDEIRDLLTRPPLGYVDGSLSGAREFGTHRSDGSVYGLLSPEAIRAVVLVNLDAVAHCHELGLQAHPDLEGRVVIRFIIGGDGAVLGAAIATITSGIPRDVGECIASAIATWRFPAPEGGGIVTVNYPFNLRHPEAP